MGDPGPFEGDIILSKYERDNLDAFLNGTLYSGLTRNAMIPGKSGTLWTGGVVPYTFAKGHFSQPWKRDVIKKAMNEYQRRTCIRFKWRTTEKNYIHMQEGRGCNSQVGMVGRRWQILNCINFGTVIHELMHAVRFWHEQSRADRDQYVWIYENNVSPRMRYNFKKYDFNKIQHLGTRYDYCSVMHYPKDAFSVNGRATIVPKQRTNCVLGAKTGFSATDIIKINKLYNCNGGGTKPTPKPTPTGTCVDDNTSCAGWAQIGECQKNPDYMLKSCRKSCNQCSTTSSKCVDKNTSCPQWASG